MKKGHPAKKKLNLSGTVSIVLLFIVVFLVFLAPKVAGFWIARSLSGQTGLPVKIGQFHLRLTRPEFSIQRLLFLNPKGFPAGEFAVMDQVRGDYLPPVILGSAPDLKRLEIDMSQVRLIRNEKGELNLPKLLASRVGVDTIDEVWLNLGPLTYTDLTGPQPVQNSFDLGLKNSVYRNVKGVSGIVEILNWEILKRTGIEEKTGVPGTEIKPIDGSPAADQTSPESAPSTPPESSPSQP